MKKILFITIITLCSSLIYAQAPRTTRDPDKDPHKPSSAIVSPRDKEQTGKPAQKPQQGQNKPPYGHNKPGHGHGQPTPPPRPGYGKPFPHPTPPINVRPLPPAAHHVTYYELEEYLHHMKLISFDSRKLSSAKSFVKNKALTAAQIAQIAKAFAFDSNRLSFAKYAYKYCLDPGNYYIVEATLTFLSSKEELRSYIFRY